MQVADAIKLLQMEHIKDSIVGSAEKRGISGGQRKRVNIGLELVADPVVLFLDEPTSGLDAHSSEVVLEALKQMTGCGLTVVTVIHQPRYSIFEKFDQMIEYATAIFNQDYNEVMERGPASPSSFIPGCLGGAWMQI